MLVFPVALMLFLSIQRRGIRSTSGKCSLRNIRSTISFQTCPIFPPCLATRYLREIALLAQTLKTVLAGNRQPPKRNSILRITLVADHFCQACRRKRPGCCDRCCKTIIIPANTSSHTSGNLEMVAADCPLYSRVPVYAN